MSITITDNQIKRIAEEIQAELTNDETGEKYPLERVIPMVENWLLRTVAGVERSPWWHAARSSMNGQTMASFEADPECAGDGWSRCLRDPLPGSAFCEDHQEENTEALAPARQ